MVLERVGRDSNLLTRRWHGSLDRTCERAEPIGESDPAARALCGGVVRLIRSHREWIKNGGGGELYGRPAKGFRADDLGPLWSATCYL